MPSFPLALHTLFITVDRPFSLSAINSDLYYRLAQYYFHRKKSSLNSYLRDVGGLLNLHDFDPSTTAQQRSPHSSFPSLKASASSLAGKNPTHDPSLIEIMAISHDAEIKKNLQQLHHALSQTVNVVARYKWFSEVTGTLDEVESLLSDMRRSYSKRHFSAMHQRLFSIGEKLLQLDRVRLHHVSEPFPIPRQFPIIREYKTFLESLLTMKYETMREVSPQFPALLANNQMLTSHYLSRLSLFNDLLRLVIIEEMRRGTSLKSPAYRGDLLQLEQFVKMKDWQTPLSAWIEPFSHDCLDKEVQSIDKVTQAPRGNPISCVAVVPSKTQWSELRVRSDHATFGNMVLYRFPPGAVRKTVNINNLFLDIDMVWDMKASQSPY